MEIDRDILERMVNSEGFSNFIKTYNVVISVFLSVCTMLVIGMIILNALKIARNSDSPMARKQGTDGLLICILSFSCLGAIDILYVIVLKFILGAVF